MASEPITVYSNKIDPKGVHDLLRSMTPAAEVEGPPDDWSIIAVHVEQGMFRRTHTVWFKHDAPYYRGADFPAQMRGMQAYISMFARNDSTPRIMELIGSFRFAVTLHPQPSPDLYIESADARLKYLFAVVKLLDGAIFTPTSIRDAAGRVLYGAGGPDALAVMPAIPKGGASA